MTPPAAGPSAVAGVVPPKHQTVQEVAGKYQPVTFSDCSTSTR